MVIFLEPESSIMWRTGVDEMTSRVFCSTAVGYGLGMSLDTEGVLRLLFVQRITDKRRNNRTPSTVLPVNGKFRESFVVERRKSLTFVPHGREVI